MANGIIFIHKPGITPQKHNVQVSIYRAISVTHSNCQELDSFFCNSKKMVKLIECHSETDVQNLLS